MFPNLIAVPLKGHKIKSSVSWVSPNVGELKFNVDGSTLGKPGLAGIEGILRDYLRMKKMAFSKPIGIADSNIAKLMAIREAFILFVSSPNWCSTHKLIIERDSANVVKWVLNIEDVPWRMRKWAGYIENLKAKLTNWGVVHIRREANNPTDALEKEGVWRATNFVEVVED
ncbi:hypothetical protein DITRI_Ditri19aG0085700 [Diplodiscus trichospermus]